jgi:hypothetical protein
MTDAIVKTLLLALALILPEQQEAGTAPSIPEPLRQLREIVRAGDQAGLDRMLDRPSIIRALQAQWDRWLGYDRAGQPGDLWNGTHCRRLVPDSPRHLVRDVPRLDDYLWSGLPDDRVWINEENEHLVSVSIPAGVTHTPFIFRRDGGEWRLVAMELPEEMPPRGSFTCARRDRR